ncbi:hypothetical protein ACOJCM_07580 [Billgrantia sp. LNSP4103-1]
MTPKRHSPACLCNRAPRAAMARGVEFDGQYWYWFSTGVPVAGS